MIPGTRPPMARKRWSSASSPAPRSPRTPSRTWGPPSLRVGCPSVPPCAHMSLERIKGQGAPLRPGRIAQSRVRAPAAPVYRGTEQLAGHQLDPPSWPLKGTRPCQHPLFSSKTFPQSLGDAPMLHAQLFLPWDPKFRGVFMHLAGGGRILSPLMPWGCPSWWQPSSWAPW